VGEDRGIQVSIIAFECVAEGPDRHREMVLVYISKEIILLREILLVKGKREGLLWAERNLSLHLGIQPFAFTLSHTT
jgi:hypothetical protein